MIHGTVQQILAEAEKEAALKKQAEMEALTSGAHQ